MRVSEAERERFHAMLEEALYNEDGSKHVHWTKLDLFELQDTLKRKQRKLDDAIRIMKVSDMVTACYEYSCVALMIADNLRGNK